MRRFFSSLRRVIALQTNRVALGQVAVDFIKRLYIPELERLIAEEDNPADQEDMEKALRLWERSSSSSGEKEWNNLAAMVVSSVVEGMWSRSADVAEDVAQQIAVDFYSAPRLTAMFDKFANIGKGDVQVKEGLTQGPIALRKMWGRTVKLRALTIMRERARKNEKFPREEGGRLPSGDEVDILDTLESDMDDLSAARLKKIKWDLERFVKGRLMGNKGARRTFDIWEELAEKKGADKINVSRDIVPRVMEEMGVKKSVVGEWAKEIRSLIHEFFQMGMARRIGSEERESLRIAAGSEGVVAFEAFGRMFCAWMLGLDPREGLR